jgi:hypothetical protein
MIGTERLVRWCISLPSQPAILFFDTFNPRVDWHKQAQEVHLTVASYYQIPLISYRDAVWHQWKALSHHGAHSSSLATNAVPGATGLTSTTLKSDGPHAGGGGGGGNGGRSKRGKRRSRFRDDSNEAIDLSEQRRVLRSASSSSMSSSSSINGAVSGGGGSSSSTDLCEALGLMPACANALWTVKALHPPWHVHQLLADLLALTLGREHAESCRKAKQQQQQQQVGLSSWLSLGATAIAAAEATTAHTTPSSSRRHVARTVPPLFGGGSSSRGSSSSSSSGGGGLGESSEQACGAPLTVMSTLRTMAMLKVVHPLGDHQGWSLEEDVPVRMSTTHVITSKHKETHSPSSFNFVDILISWGLKTRMLLFLFLPALLKEKKSCLNTPPPLSLGLESLLFSCFSRENPGGLLSLTGLRSLLNSISKAAISPSATFGPMPTLGGRKFGLAVETQQQQEEQLEAAAGGGGSMSATGAAMAASPMVLDGIWDEHKSEFAKSASSGVGHGRLRVHFRSRCNGPSCKFKLLLLMSC